MRGGVCAKTLLTPMFQVNQLFQSYMEATRNTYKCRAVACLGGGRDLVLEQLVLPRTICPNVQVR
jgi:hypothetical protein